MCAASTRSHCVRVGSSPRLVSVQGRNTPQRPATRFAHRKQRAVGARRERVEAQQLVSCLGVGASAPRAGHLDAEDPLDVRPVTEASGPSSGKARPCSERTRNFDPVHAPLVFGRNAREFFLCDAVPTRNAAVRASARSPRNVIASSPGLYDPRT